MQSKGTIQVQRQLQTQRVQANNRLQRTCACGQHTIAGGECQKCRTTREAVNGRAAMVPLPFSASTPEEEREETRQHTLQVLQSSSQTQPTSPSSTTSIEAILSPEPQTRHSPAAQLTSPTILEQHPYSPLPPPVKEALSSNDHTLGSSHTDLDGVAFQPRFQPGTSP